MVVVEEEEEDDFEVVSYLSDERERTSFLPSFLYVAD